MSAPSGSVRGVTTPSGVPTAIANEQPTPHWHYRRNFGCSCFFSTILAMLVYRMRKLDAKSGPSRQQYAIQRSTRLRLEIPVLFASLDHNHEFSELCETIVVNAHGCGLIAHRPLEYGTPVRLEIRTSKRNATARVAEVVLLGGQPESWLIGIELDQPGNFWGIEYAPADWIIATPSESPAEGQVQGPSRVESTSSGGGAACAARSAPSVSAYRLTDISVGACYVETPASLPAGSQVVLSIRVANQESTVSGIVRVAHTGSGMGIEFRPRIGDHLLQVEQLIRMLQKDREVPRVLVAEGRNSHPTPGANSAESPELKSSGDALLELVRKGDSLTLEQFLWELKDQRLGKRLEPRTSVALSVRIAATDVEGHPIVQTVTTRNISQQGALLDGLQVQLYPGSIVSLTYRYRKGRFRVAWVGEPNTPRAGQIGVIAVDTSISFWN